MSKWAIFWVGALFGMFVVFLLVVSSPVGKLGKQAEGFIEQCQKDLPRDQYCTIIAVPENEIEE